MQKISIDNKKVRDHCHYNGKYRGAAHNAWNVNCGAAHNAWNVNCEGSK